MRRDGSEFSVYFYDSGFENYLKRKLIECSLKTNSRINYRLLYYLEDDYLDILKGSLNE